MFSNAYQNGPCFQIWDAKVDPSKNPFYKQLSKTIPNQNLRAFDKEVKSFLYNLQGQNSRIVLPAEDNKALSLHQRYLVLQIFIPFGYQWWVEIGMSDLVGIRRRINLTTVQGKQEGKYFSYRYPLEVTRGKWLFLGIDVFSFMNAFKDQTFRALDQITIGSTCRLRRIFTMKDFVQYQIPNGYWLTQELSQSLELVQFHDHLNPSFGNKQLTESVASTKKQQKIKKSMSGSKVEDHREVNRTEVASYIKANSQITNSNIVKSELIIKNARQRLKKLQQEEQLLVKKSKQLQASPNFKQNLTDIKSLNKKNQIKNSIFKKERPLQSIKQRSDRKELKNIEKGSPKDEKTKFTKGKLPHIQKPFKQDEALNLKLQYQSSVPTEQHLGGDSRKFLQSKEVIEQDHWTQSRKAQSRPISEAISTFSNIRGGKGEIGINMFPSTVITKENNKQVILTKSKLQLQLIYDEMAGCYYHPQTNSYYEIKP